MMINLNTANYMQQHEKALRAMVESANIPAARIKEAMLYSLFPGGKRLRPMLVYLCGELIEANPRALDYIAVAIELMHCYSLIHDDLPSMDNDDFRRGKPSCHRAFDEATAILVGDGMQALAIDSLLTHLPEVLPLSNVIHIAHDLLQACGPAGMVSGQSLDLSELTKPTLSVHELANIHMLKTGQLIMACINMVLSAANPSKSATSTLRQFAKSLGLVFQMQDDYLDHYGINDPLGKGRASDAANEKITFATLYTKESLSACIHEHFQQAECALIPFGPRAAKLHALLNTLKQRSIFIENNLKQA